MKRLFLALGCAAILGSAVARTSDVPTNPKQIHRSQFSGWNGITLFCDKEPDDQTAKRLCDWAGQRLRNLVIPLGVPVELVPEGYFKWLLGPVVQGAADNLQLHLLIKATEAAPLAVLIRLSAEEGYLDAISRRELNARPRVGSLVMWSDEFIVAAGSRGPDLNTELRQRLETILLRFMADFAEGRS